MRLNMNYVQPSLHNFLSEKSQNPRQEGFERFAE
jgi:hypothetical protein